ncbi:hypothetical protein CRE_04772 [Caenorhabditis remanei]|uniref:H15 domain-containing protein n=1 Tax=Caenorhabditis remanei TaxID=31234 RepID=E3LZ66_CAERE|nr:hypothetical protein CRE_04772 [Caenorhabditis remanei]
MANRVALPRQKAAKQASPKAPKSPKSPAARAGKAAKAEKTAVASKIPKVQKIKTVADHPAYLVMVTAAINDLKERKGASKQAILKHISNSFHLVNAVNTEKKVRSKLALALKKGVASGALLQVTGTGASGRFKLAKAGATPKAPSTPKAAKKTSVVAPSPSEKKAKSPKKAAVKPAAKKNKKAPVTKKTSAKAEVAV